MWSQLHGKAGFGPQLLPVPSSCSHGWQRLITGQIAVSSLDGAAKASPPENQHPSRSIRGWCCCVKMKPQKSLNISDFLQEPVPFPFLLRDPTIPPQPSEGWHGWPPNPPPWPPKPRRWPRRPAAAKRPPDRRLNGPKRPNDRGRPSRCAKDRSPDGAWSHRLELTGCSWPKRGPPWPTKGCRKRCGRTWEKFLSYHHLPPIRILACGPLLPYLVALQFSNTQWYE